MQPTNLTLNLHKIDGKVKGLKSLESNGHFG